jgi:hypothetical protein
MRCRTNATLLTALLLVGSTLYVWPRSTRAETITASEAKNHIGENATVCGQVASTKYAASSRGQPTFLNLDAPYPSQIFTVLIWGSDRPKFNRPEITYRDRRLCVTGEIRAFRGVPEVVAHDPGQIKVESAGRK